MFKQRAWLETVVFDKEDSLESEEKRQWCEDNGCLSE